MDLGYWYQPGMNQSIGNIVMEWIEGIKMGMKYGKGNIVMGWKQDIGDNSGI